MKFKKKGEPKKRLANYLFVMVIIIVVLRVPLEGVKESLEIKLLPIKEKIYMQTNSIKLGIANLKEYKEIMAENSKLQIEVVKIGIYKNELSVLETENARLKELLEMKENTTEKFVVAKVSFKDSITYHENIYIDVGLEDGIKKDMIVLTEKTIIGRIIEVYEKSSRVELITKSDVYTSALTTEDQHLGVLKGNNSEELTLENISVDKDVEVGDEVITSGISDIYPKGLYLGTVTSVDEGSDMLFKEITLTQNFNIFNLNEVIVLGEE